MCWQVSGFVAKEKDTVSEEPSRSSTSAIRRDPEHSDMQRAGSAIPEHAPVPAVLGLNVTTQSATRCCLSLTRSSLLSSTNASRRRLMRIRYVQRRTTASRHCETQYVTPQRARSWKPRLATAPASRPFTASCSHETGRGRARDSDQRGGACAVRSGRGDQHDSLRRN